MFAPALGVFGDGGGMTVHIVWTIARLFESLLGWATFDVTHGTWISRGFLPPINFTPSSYSGGPALSFFQQRLVVVYAVANGPTRFQTLGWGLYDGSRWVGCPYINGSSGMLGLIFTMRTPSLVQYGDQLYLFWQDEISTQLSWAVLPSVHADDLNNSDAPKCGLWSVYNAVPYAPQVQGVAAVVNARDDTLTVFYTDELMRLGFMTFDGHHWTMPALVANTTTSMRSGLMASYN